MGMTHRFRLVLSDGLPADPPELRTTELNWRQGDVIPLGRERSLRVLGGRERSLRVLGVRDQPPVLVVEDMPGAASSAAG